MDSVATAVENAPWISQKINVAKFKTEWINELESIHEPSLTFDHYLQPVPSSALPDIDIKVLNSMNLSPEILASLKYDCGIQTLDCGNTDIETFGRMSKARDRQLSAVPTDVNLMTLHLQKDDLKEREKSIGFRSNTFHSWSQNYRMEQPLVYKKSKEENSDNPGISKDDVVLAVQIFRPSKYDNNNTNLTNQVVDHELYVLGSQKLSELRDHIKCLADEAIVEELSDNPNQTTPPPAKVSTSTFLKK